MKYDNRKSIFGESSMRSRRFWIRFSFCLLLSACLALPGSPLSAQEEAEPGGQAMITMDFQDVELPVLVKFISELTGKNFILDEKVKGKRVTIISPTKITKDEAYRVFESILDIKGLTTVPSGRIIKILPVKDATTQNLETVVGKERLALSDSVLTRLIPLQYVNSEEMVNILKPLMSRESQIDAYGPTNTLILTDTSSNIARLMRILKELDVEADEMIMAVLPLEYASAEILAGQLQEILETLNSPGSAAGVSSGVQRRPPGSPRVTPGRPSGTQGSGFSGKILADDRTNSLVILATISQLKKIRELVQKLDYDTPRAYGNINVYYLEYSNAEDMAKVLTDLVSGAQSTTGNGKKGAAGAAAAPVSAAARTMASFESEVSITADASTNSLIVVAFPRDYQTIRNVIQKLDIRRKQVYVEAVIMEISPTFLQDIGFEFRGGIPLQSGDQVDQVLMGGTNFGLGADDLFGSFAGLAAGTAAGADTTLFPMQLGSRQGLNLGAVFDQIKIPIGDGKELAIPAQMFLLHALQRTTKSNILSTPHLIAIDNEESEIVVGKNVPFITSTSQSTVSTVQNIQRENVGITLRFTPQITEGDYIQLELYQEISALIDSPVGQDVNTVGPTTSTRKATNVVLVRDGQTIVVGGLMEDRINTVKNKVPWVGDIPVIGWLFRYDTEKVDKSNLLIFLTPTIIREDQDVQRLFEEKKRKMLEYKKKYKISDKYMETDELTRKQPAYEPPPAPPALEYSVAPAGPASAVPAPTQAAPPAAAAPGGTPSGTVVPPGNPGDSSWMPPPPGEKPNAQSTRENP
jgi:general secretion pathway protein D